MDRPEPNSSVYRPAAPTLPLAPVRVAAPAAISATASGPGQAFGGLFGELHQEISRYIADGAATDQGGGPATHAGGAGEALNAEARARLSLWQGPAAADAPTGVPSEGQQAFLDSIAPWAAEAGQRLGVAPDIIAAHAALESGWGQRPLRNADGSSTHNLFGLKAQAGWQGGAADALTTEYEAGGPVKRTERFRSYDDPAGAFRDFSRLLQESPRYQGALNTGSDARAYAQALARGGYATDPAYADKLSRIAARVQGAARAAGD